MFISSYLTDIILFFLYISIPILVIYIGYLIFTQAFRYMGFTSIEAIIIVFVSFIFDFDIIVFGVNISNIYLFSYGNWLVGINMGGALIPILLSIYLVIKNKLPLKKIIIGIIIVTIIAFLVTYPDPNKGIVAKLPIGLLPAFFASIISIAFLYKDFKKAAPFAYILGTLGVLIGADFLHLSQLLSYQIDKPINAVIGGANVFDMVYISGIVAVILDGIILFKQRKNLGIN